MFTSKNNQGGFMGLKESHYYRKVASSDTSCDYVVFSKDTHAKWNKICWVSFLDFLLGVKSPPGICVRSSQEMIFWIFDIKSRIAHLFKGEEDAMLALYDHLE